MLAAAHERRGYLEVFEPTFAVPLAAQTMSRTLMLAHFATPLRERSEVQQERPASQASLRTRLVAMQASARVEQPIHPVHRPVHRIARSPTTGMFVRHRIFLGPLPQFGRHLTHRCRPRLRLEPPSKRLHAATEFL